MGPTSQLTFLSTHQKYFHTHRKMLKSLMILTNYYIFLQRCQICNYNSLQKINCTAESRLAWPQNIIIWMSFNISALMFFRSLIRTRCDGMMGAWTGFNGDKIITAIIFPLFKKIIRTSFSFKSFLVSSNYQLIILKKHGCWIGL